MPKIRDQVFLGCKTSVRDTEGAWAECNRSLERLQTDRFDLYQLHSVGKLDVLDGCTRKGGSLEALIRAKEQGLTTWLGITGHTQCEQLGRDALQIKRMQELMRQDDGSARGSSPISRSAIVTVRLPGS
jgi:predicted aldo/keto reductase-like oxidoreductase